MGEQVSCSVSEPRIASPKIFWPSIAVGWATIGFGVFGLFENSARTHPDQWVRWFLGALVVHDLVVAPAVFAIGVLLARRVPESYRGPIQGALIITGILVLVSFPFVRGYGQRADNPSALPNDYGTGLLVLVAVVWLVTSLFLWRARLKSHRRPPSISA